MTMLAHWKQIAGVALTILWTTAFGVLSWRVAHTAVKLRQEYEQTAQSTQTLQQESREITRITQELASQSHEIDFLQGLVNVLPQEKGFVRTQRAISDEVESLRAKVARRLRGELNVVVDTKANKLYLKQGVNLLWQADCSVGRGGVLKDPVTGRRWAFVTPRGQFEVLDKIEKPLWTKPDWAFVETHEPVPPPGDPKRKVEGELGAYVLNLGDGYLIHGTKTPELLGHSVSHGCVRLGADDLKKLYETVSRGTKVYIY